MLDTPPVALLHRRTGRKWSRYAADVLPAWIADMDFAPAPVIAATIDEAVALGDLGYGPTGTDSGVPQAFAGWAARRWGWRPDPADMMLMPDVVGGIANCIEALTEPGDAILVQTPAYPPLMSSVRVAGRRLVTHALTPDGRIDVEDLDRTLAAERVRMLLFCSPHNPTGRVFGADELAAVARLAEAHDLVVIADEVHADLTLPGAQHIPFACVEGTAGRTVTLTAPSKAFNVAGLRAALCHAEAPLRRRLAALPSTRWTAFSTLGLRAANAAWTEGEPWLDACVAHLSAMRDLVARGVADMGLSMRPPEAGYLAWIDCRGTATEDPADFFLREAKVALSPGPDFGAEGAGFVRLNFATSAELLIEILDRMAAALR
jgi:cystathionine beta-lyase